MATPDGKKPKEEEEEYHFGQFDCVASFFSILWLRSQLIKSPGKRRLSLAHCVASFFSVVLLSSELIKRLGKRRLSLAQCVASFFSIVWLSRRLIKSYFKTGPQPERTCGICDSFFFLKMAGANCQCQIK